MGRKVHPRSFRLGTIFTWDSMWFADKKRYKTLLLDDDTIRTALIKKLKSAGIARVGIERSINTVDVILHVARPGMVIGRSGQGLDQLKKFVEELVHKSSGNTTVKVDLKVEQVKEPNLDATLVASNIADQIERRIPHKRAIMQSMEKVMGAGAKGVKIMLAGRINGAEIARREKYHQGEVPLSTIRENVDFCSHPALTKSGYVGVKVWICRPQTGQSK